MAMALPAPRACAVDVVVVETRKGSFSVFVSNMYVVACFNESEPSKRRLNSSTVHEFLA